MSNLAILPSDRLWQHSTAEEYANWLSPRLSTAASVDTFLDERLSFIRKYPDLNEWL
jgi:hypothetical protein